MLCNYASTDSRYQLITDLNFYSKTLHSGAQGHIQDFAHGEGGIRKTLKNVTKLYQFAVLLRFYEPDEHFLRGENPSPRVWFLGESVLTVMVLFEAFSKI